jgi:dinuclear metal center YbgI/SA1388 family protein
MATARELARLCDRLTDRKAVADFPGARNGLQFDAGKPVRRIGAAVDAGTEVFAQARRAGVDFLIVHHGIHWKPTLPGAGVLKARRAALARHGLSLYSSHLPLDAHPTLGNNALIARRLGLEVDRWFLDVGGTPIALLCKGVVRSSLRSRLRKAYPRTFTAIEHGSARPRRVAILSGSGRSALPALAALGCDTLVTGELREEHYNDAHEQGWNLYPCGHYATETHGVKALAAAIAKATGLPWTFVRTDNPL